MPYGRVRDINRLHDPKLGVVFRSTDHELEAHRPFQIRILGEPTLVALSDCWDLIAHPFVYRLFGEAAENRGACSRLLLSSRIASIPSITRRCSKGSMV